MLYLLDPRGSRTNEPFSLGSARVVLELLRSLGGLVEGPAIPRTEWEKGIVCSTSSGSLSNDSLCPPNSVPMRWVLRESLILLLGITAFGLFCLKPVNFYPPSSLISIKKSNFFVLSLFIPLRCFEADLALRIGRTGRGLSISPQSQMILFSPVSTLWRSMSGSSSRSKSPPPPTKEEDFAYTRGESSLDSSSSSLCFHSSLLSKSGVSSEKESSLRKMSVSPSELALACLFSSGMKLPAFCLRCLSPSGERYSSCLTLSSSNS